VKAAQTAQARSLGELGRLIKASELESAPWSAPYSTLLASWAQESAQVLAGCGEALRDSPFADFEAHNLRAANSRALAYEQAHEAHSEAKKKVEGKQEKRRLPALQQAEREAFRKGAAKYKVAKTQLELLEEDLEKRLLNAARDVAHSQLALHAKGLEHFTQVIETLGRNPS